MERVEQPTRRATSGSLEVDNPFAGIKSWLEILPANHPYRIHGTEHIDIVGETFTVLRVEQSCEYCRHNFKLEA